MRSVGRPCEPLNRLVSAADRRKTARKARKARKTRKTRRARKSRKTGRKAGESADARAFALAASAM